MNKPCMNPLAAYLVSVMKNEETSDTRRYYECMNALEELGYWTLIRPAGVTRSGMPPCRITEMCILVDEFPSYCANIGAYEGFDIVVDVYADPLITAGEPT